MDQLKEMGFSEEAAREVLKQFEWGENEARFIFLEVSVIEVLNMKMNGSHHARFWIFWVGQFDPIGRSLI